MQPAEKTNDIISQLNKMEVNAKGNVFHLLRYRRDAEALVKDNPSAAYDMLGAIACLEMDHESMHKFYHAAIDCSDGNPERYANYSISLGRLGFAKEAYEYISQALERSSIPWMKYLFIHRAIEAGRFCVACDILGSLEEAELKDLPNIANRYDFIVGAADLVRQLGLSDDDIAAVVYALNDEFHSLGLYGYGASRSIIRNDAPFILCEYVFRDDVDFLELGFRVDNLLASLQLKDGVADILEIDFAAKDKEQKAPQIIPFPKEKMELIRSLVAGVTV